MVCRGDLLADLGAGSRGQRASRGDAFVQYADLTGQREHQSTQRQHQQPEQQIRKYEQFGHEARQLASRSRLSIS